jgi:hypothetical protein
MAVHAVRRMPNPVLLRLDIVGAGSVTIDTARTEYAGDLVLTSALAVPECVVIATHPATGIPLPGARDLDPLLWFVGLNAFDDRPASWLWPDDRYRLVRWPNLLDAGTADIRMFAALANAHLSPAELASVAGTDGAAARRVINALTLMGVLDTSSHVPPPQPAATTTKTTTTGLFGRLRRRLGLA